MDFDPLDPDVLQCPYPHYARLRHAEAVAWSDRIGAFLVTRHDLVTAVVRDTETFSSRYGRASMPVPPEHQARIDAVVAEGYPRVPTLLTQDRPEHTRFRRLVSKAFTPARVGELEPAMRRIAGTLIDGWIDRDVVDFVGEFAVPYPVEVIATLLNVPDGDRAAFTRWADAVVSTIGTDVTIDQRIESERGVNELDQYVAQQLATRRVEPLDDLLTDLLQARIDDDSELVDRRPLDLPEMLSMIRQIVVAGSETAANTLAEAMLLLARHPEEWDRLRAEPARIPVVVEEVLRLLTPSQALWRVATTDTVLDGVAVAAGSRLVVNYASANHDRTIFGDHADEFDPDRPRLGEHLAFGKGVHYCLGANLARLEIRVALEELRSRLASITVDPEAKLRYCPSFALRGLDRLELGIVAA